MVSSMGSARLNLARASARRRALTLYKRDRVIASGHHWPMGHVEERAFFAGFNAGFTDGHSLDAYGNEGEL